MMATFKAVNLESDDESDDEIDNTKEIQIEEALKLYQVALKLHSSPQTLEQAGAAYHELFNSDVFKFPESQSEYNRLAELDTQQDADSGFIDFVEEEVATAPAATENAPSSLPQILHLSFKNRAEYYLDRLRSQIPSDAASSEDGDQQLKVVELAQKALNDFAEALDKDEDDIEIWRRSARVAQALDSCRITRFCLESTVRGEEEGPDNILSVPNFEARFDSQGLQDLCKHVQDDANMKQPPEEFHQISARDTISRRPPSVYSFLPSLSSISADAQRRSRRLTSHVENLVIQGEEHSLDGIVDAFVQHMHARECVIPSKSIEANIRLELPPLGHEDPDRNKLTFQLTAKSHEPHGLDGVSQRPSHTPSAESKGEQHPSELRTNQENQEPAQVSPTKHEAPRKRSAEMANIHENADGERAKSRRTRSRKSVTGDRATETKGLDLTPGGDPKHEVYLQADRWLFDLMKDVLRRMDVKLICNADDIRRIVSPNSPYGVGEGFQRISLVRAMQDFYATMLSWTATKTEIFNHTRPSHDQTHDKGDTGLLAFLDSAPRRGRKPASPMISEVHEFVEHINNHVLSVQQATVLLCQILLTKRRPVSNKIRWNRPPVSPYLNKPWSDEMKQNIEEMCVLVNEDLIHYTTIQLPFDQDDGEGLSDAFELAQSLFELHLDMYARTSSSNSMVDSQTKSDHKLLADRWCQISRELLTAVTVRHFSTIPDDATTPNNQRLSPMSQLDVYLRHLWASVFHLKAGGEITREYLAQCIGDLKEQIRSNKSSSYRMSLHNNATMPEISLDAADRETVKLDTMDFFLSIFNQTKEHPVDLIEKLEPILIPDAEASGGTVFTEGRERRREKKAHNTSQAQSRHDILSEFVKKADSSLRLSLWYKLRDSYRDIDFPSKVLFIDFRILEVLMNELQSLSYIHAETEERERLLFRRLKDLHDVLRRISFSIDDKNTGLGCLDTPQLKSSTQNLVGLFTLLHSVTLYDDYSQALHKGPLLPNPFRAYPAESFFAVSKLFHEMQLHTFILIYKMLAEAAIQLPERIPLAQANVDRYEYLQYVHYALGVRRLCKAEDNLFLRFMHKELLNLQGQPIINDVAQILFDMYDLRCFTQASERQDHGCDADRLDRSTAIKLVDFVLDQTHGANIKDLPKADLGKSVEKMQNAIGPPTSTFAIHRNRRVLSTYMKSSVSPQELFQSLKGVGALSTTTCPPHEAPIASKGWYFLIGMINLAKHKRSRDNDNSKVAEDVNVAVKYLTHDLEFDAEKWETWFRLGYGNDWLLEEQVLWQSDKLQSEEVLKLQRTALHAYSQASALALRFADDTQDTHQKLAMMYLEFALRVYSSSRPPFSMHAFGLQHYSEKLCSGVNSGGTYSFPPFKPLHPQQALRVAAALCHRAIAYRSGYWLNHFILGKCLWKMHQYIAGQGSSDSKLAMDALSQFHQACDVLGRRRDPNRTEPTLEPIYKVVFVIQKLVSSKHLTPNEGADHIKRAFEVQKQVESLRSVPDFDESTSWTDHVIKILKQVRQADRQKWHHRVVYKTAHLIYDQLIHSAAGSAEAARHAKEFLEKNNMYSQKTAALSVWKPEMERPGRHWVYMTSYARFVSRLLEETKDIEFMQTFTRRIRRKTNEFFEHENLWEDVLNAHLRLHRRHANVPEHAHTTVFADMNIEQFRPKAAAVDSWCCSPDTKHVLVDTLREIEDIKKMNNKLVSDTAVDELMCDIYAHIFASIGPTLPSNETIPVNKGLDASAQQTPNTATPEPPSEKKGVMSLSNMMNVDGAPELSGAAIHTNWRPISMPSNPPAITSSHPDAMAHRPRAPRSVTRRDVLKHAQESCITKVTAVREGNEGKDAKAIVSSDARVVVSVPSSGAHAQERGKRTDDGDASSELSDPDENADDEMGPHEQESSSTAKEEGSPVPRPMFPGLKTKISKDASGT